MRSGRERRRTVADRLRALGIATGHGAKAVAIYFVSARRPGPLESRQIWRRLGILCVAMYGSRQAGITGHFQRTTPIGFGFCGRATSCRWNGAAACGLNSGEMQTHLLELGIRDRPGTSSGTEATDRTAELLVAPNSRPDSGTATDSRRS